MTAEAFFVAGLLLTITIELPVLSLALAPRHPWRTRVEAALWLNVCSYPVVTLVLPHVFDPVRQRGVYLAIAETFAPAVEAALFAIRYGTGTWRRDTAAIVAANLVSFGFGVAWSGG